MYLKKNQLFKFTVALVAIVLSCFCRCKKDESDEYKFTDTTYSVHLYIDGNDSTFAVSDNRPEYSDISFSYKNGDKVIIASKSARNNYSGPEGVVGKWEYSESDKILSLTFTVNAIDYYGNPFWNVNKVDWDIIHIEERYYMVLRVNFQGKNCQLDLDRTQ